MLWPVLGPSSFWNIPPCRCRVEHVDVVPGPGPARGSSTTVQIRWDVWSPRRAPRSPFHQFQTFHQKMWENKLRSVLIATDVAARGLDIKGQPPTTLQVFEWIDIGLGHTGSYWVTILCAAWDLMKLCKEWPWWSTMTVPTAQKIMSIGASACKKKGNVEIGHFFHPQNGWLNHVESV